MRNKLIILLVVCFGNFWSGQAQTEAAYTHSSSNFVKLAERKEYQQAIEEGVKVSVAFTQDRAYQEAFATCRQLDALINKAEGESGQKQDKLRYLVAKERMRMYTRLKNVEQSNRYLEELRGYVQGLKLDSLQEDFYLTEASHYHQLGLTEKSFDSYKKLFDFRSAGKDNQTKDSCYKEMLSYAETTNNPSLAVAMRKLYTDWQDSIKVVEAAHQLEVLTFEQGKRQQELQLKDDKIETQFQIILVSLVVAGLLLILLIYVALSLLRLRMKNQKQKRIIAELENTNHQKSTLISTIAAQIEPSLSLIEESTRNLLPAESTAQLSIQAVKNLVTAIETYVGLEMTKGEKYGTENISISNLCKEVMEEAQLHFNPGVTAVVNTPPHVMLKTNQAVVKKILLHLLMNASQHTVEGRITLEFKKRRADAGQFIITDTGKGIDPKELDALFVPFSKVYDLLDGTGLGLPTCALMAQKLNGALSVDLNYKKGARFIFEFNA
ncbi:MAG: sensor histidine kinase [Phocaeicola sp.]